VLKSGCFILRPLAAELLIHIHQMSLELDDSTVQKAVRSGA